MKIGRIIVLGPDEFTYESYMTLPDGKEFKSLEQRGGRVK